MFLLLTGLPGTGKTTVLQHFLDHDREDCFWIVSRELRNAQHERVGFEVVTSNGDQGVFAHKESIHSEHVMGSYRVDLPVIDRLFSDSVKQELANKRLLVLDEIGRMQMLSSTFQKTIDDLFMTDHDVLATIRHGDEWTEKYTKHPNTVLIEVTEQNRQELPEVLHVIFTHQKEFRILSKKQQGEVLTFLKTYFASSQFIQIKKLFQHALPYLVADKVRKTEEGGWEVIGDHNHHLVTLDPHTKKYSCDCDLFLGKGIHANKPGECSHIQASILFG